MSRTTIIIPTYNHLEDQLKPCIESIIEYTELGGESGSKMVVIANGCTDGTEEYLEHMSSLHPWLRYKVVSEPIGYTKAINMGIAMAMHLDDPERVILLNNDVRLLEQRKNGWVELLEEGFSHGYTGITGVIEKRDEVVNDIEFLIFFCVMISRYMIHEVGMLDERFSPGFGEDIDYCERVRRAGYDVTRVPVGDDQKIEGGMYVCNFPIYHVGTQTFKDVENYPKIVDRNRKLLIEKYYEKK